MPVNPTYPGVYIEELQSGVRTITGVATSVTAFIGRASRGPDNQAITINSFADFERSFGGLRADSMLGYTVRDFYFNGGSQAIIVRLHNGATAATLDLSTGGTSPNDKLTLVASSVGSWGNNLKALVDYNTKDPKDNTLFNLTVFELNGATEKFINVSIDSKNPRYLPLVLKQSSNLVGMQWDSQNATWLVPNVRPQEVASTNPAAVTQQGTDGGMLIQDQFTTNTRANKTGLYALEQVDLFNILCIPPYNQFNNVDTNLLSLAAAYCESRRAILLVDSPSGWNSTAIAIGKPGDPNDTGIAALGVNSKNAALFFPRLLEADPLRENQIAEVVPCGAVAGTFARTDTQRGVWKAPAGLDATLVGVPQLTVPLTDQENGQLNTLGINCLRSFPAAGRVIWGARTLQGDDRLASEWKYLPVRRTALYIEESLYRGTQWVIFEPNDEPLWAQIRLNVGAFMQNLFRKGAFKGSTPREAYFVKCDKETTIQNDIDLGIVNIVVGFAPLKPAEFVIIKLQQLAGQIAA